MRLLLDSANLDEIGRCRRPLVAGVTTNPSLMAKEKKGDYIESLESIRNALKPAVDDPRGECHLSVEVISRPDEMYEQAVILNQRLWRPGVDLYIKIPISTETTETIYRLNAAGISVNATACMTTAQAKLAVDCGAKIVSFFFRRACDFYMKEFESQRAREFVLQQIGGFLRFKDDRVNIICGSIRTPEDVMECWQYGADYVTAPLKVIEQMIHHPKTQESIESFQRDIDAWRA